MSGQPTTRATAKASRRARTSARAARTSRRRRPSRKLLATGLGVSAALAGSGYLYSRRDGTTELPATLDHGRTTGPGTIVDDGTAGVPAASLHLPAGLAADHLLDRVSYGATDALRADVARRGAAAWLAEQLAPGRLPDPDGDAVAALFPHLSLSAADAARTVADPGALQDELAAAHLGRAVWSHRQLLELMVDLWSNHFGIPCPTTKAPFTRHRLDADIFRRGALGSFEALLRGCTLHPATLAHLDSAASGGDHPNENHARELLEIHTVGTASGFTERDVRQAALLLTGFEVRDGVPRYVPGRHHVGKVAVLGFTHRNESADGGIGAVEQFLSYLANHPATATNLARTLAVRFVADSPPEALVRRLSQVYLTGRTAIAPVLAALFTSPEFAASAGAKTRRPMERLAATIRTLGLGPGKDPAALKDLLLMLDAAGQRPLASDLPGGYPDVAAAWQSPAVATAEFNAVAQLVHGWWPRTLVNPGPARLLRAQPATRAAAVEAVGRRVLGRAPTAVERAGTLKLLATSKLPTRLAAGSWEQKETIGLIATLLLCSPAATHR